MKKTFKKQILRYGEWDHPAAKDGKLSITKDYVKKLVDNFKVSPFAPVTRGHVGQEEAERNPGLIINKNIDSLEQDDEGLNAVMKVDEKELDDYNDVSVSIDQDYVDHESGKELGPLIKHVAMVMNPYIKGLNPFLAMGEASNLVINLSDIMSKKKKSEVQLEDETKAEVEESKDETTEEVEETEETKEETTEDQKIEESEGSEEPVNASELSSEIAKLKVTVALQEKKLAEQDAESRYISLREKGKVTPAVEQIVKDLYMSAETAIELSDGKSKTVGVLLDELFEKMPKVINLSEKGVNGEEVKLSDSLKSDLRKMHSNKSDAEFDEWLEKNDKVIKEAQSELK